MYFTSYISIELGRPALSSRLELGPTAIAVHFSPSRRGSLRDVVLPKIYVVVGGRTVLLKITEMALIFAFVGISPEMVPRQHLAHI